MVTRADVVTEARTWLETPFHHQGRLKGVGVDCVGLVIGVAQALGLSDFDITDYPRQPDPDVMRRLLQAHLDPVPFTDRAVGDILWYRLTFNPQHLGILSSIEPMTMIHAFQRPGVDRCLEQAVDRFWHSRIAGCFRLRGLE